MTSLAVPYTLGPTVRPAHPSIRLLAAGGWLVSLVAVILGAAIWATDDFPRLPLSFASGPVNVIGVALIALTTVSVGAILAWRHPRNAIGWALLVQGACAAFLTPVNLLVGQAFNVVQPWPETTVAAAWLMSSLLTPVAAAIAILVFLLFPDGRFAGRHWWIAGPATVVGTGLLAAASALDPTGLVWYPAVPNPTAVSNDYAGFIDALRLAGVAVTVVALVLAGGSVTHRYRRADHREQLQLRWVVGGVAVMGLTFIPFLVGRYVLGITDPRSDVLLAVMALGASCFPVTIAVAIVREHLYEIDDLIWHTLVYVPLMGLLGGLYTASLALFQRLFVSLTGNGSDAAIVLSSLLLAWVFTPTRQAIEARVTRRFKPVPPADRHRELGEPMSVPSGDPLDVRLDRRGRPADDRQSMETLVARVAALERELAGREDGAWE